MKRNSVERCVICMFICIGGIIFFSFTKDYVKVNISYASAMWFGGIGLLIIGIGEKNRIK